MKTGTKWGAEFAHLKRLRQLNQDGSARVRANPKHIESAAKILGIETSKSAPTLAVAGGSQSKNDKDLGSLMYVAPDRPDCQYAIRELAKDLRERKGNSAGSHQGDAISDGNPGQWDEIHTIRHDELFRCLQRHGLGKLKARKEELFRAGGRTLATYSWGLGVVCLARGRVQRCSCSGKRGFVLQADPGVLWRANYGQDLDGLERSSRHFPTSRRGEFATWRQSA